MDRRTFLQTAATICLATGTGCSGLLDTHRSTTEIPRGEWRQAAGGPGNTATAPPVQGTRISWTSRLPAKPVTPPVVSNELAVVGTAVGHVVGVDLQSGEEVWRRKTSGVHGAPAIIDDWVVVAADDGRLHRISLVDGSDPQATAVTSSLKAAVSMDGDHVFVVASGELVAVDVPNWRVDWRASLPTVGAGLPAVTDNRVVASGRRPDGTGSIVAVDRSDGETVWEKQTTANLGSTPLATDRAIVVGGAPSNRIVEPDSDEQSEKAGLFWFDPESGAIRRTETVGAPIWGHCTVRSIVGTDDDITITGCNSLVHYGADGPRWSSSLAQGVTTRPIRTPVGVLVGDSDGQFWLVDDGTQSRLFTVDGLPSTPAVLERGLVVPAGRTLVGLA